MLQLSRPRWMVFRMAVLLLLVIFLALCGIHLLVPHGPGGINSLQLALSIEAALMALLITAGAGTQKTFQADPGPCFQGISETTDRPSDLKSLPVHAPLLI